MTVLAQENAALFYNDLAEGIDIPQIYKFSTDDDVLHLLEEGHKGTPGTKSGRTQLLCCCGVSRAAKPSLEQVWPSPSGASFLMRAVNEYETYGIYFEASSRIEYQGAALFPPDPRFGKYLISWSWTQKCNNPESKSDTYGGLRDYQMDWNPNLWGSWVFKNKIYSGTKGLRQLSLSASYGPGISGSQQFFPGTF